MNNKFLKKIEDFVKDGDVLNNIKETVKNNEIFYFSILAIIIIIIIVFVYIQNKLTLNEKNCKKLKNIYTEKPPLSSITINDNLNNYLLRDFYIKSAYNCCSAGNFKNDYVNLCALKNCIEQGARFLDFEIYSLNDKPIVATSSISNFNIKQSYNYIELSKVFDTILNLAFSSGTCPNHRDPLILHFRIMSNNCKMFDNFADLFIKNNRLNSRTLEKKYSYEYSENNNSLNLTAEPVKKFKDKIIIALDTKNSLYRNTKLEEYVNISTSSIYLKLLKFNDVKQTYDFNFEDYNKKNMSIVIPDLQSNSNNYNFIIPKNYGCQFMAMSFQNNNSNLQQYNNFFKNERYGYVLKPENLRHIPLTIPNPIKQDPQLSYAPRNFKTDYYNYEI